MLTIKAQIFLTLLTATLLPSTLSFPYPIYGITNYRRAARANNNYASLHQTNDQKSYHPSSSTFYNGYQQPIYDSDIDNYYVDDEGNDQPEREYLYGKPTYHGEYNPSRFYYARAPSYSLYDDHAEPSNPLDDLHEEMLHEDQRDQQQWPAGKTQWFQSTDQPKSLTNNFIKNLMLYNEGINPELMKKPEIDINNAYDDENDNNPYYSEISREPYDYYDELKTHQPFNRFESISSFDKPNYFNPNSNDKQTTTEDGKATRYRKPITNIEDKELTEDKEEQDLISLRKNHKHDDFHSNPKYSLKNSKSNDKSSFSPEHGYDTSIDYDDDAWINWDRKRSLQNNVLSPLKVLEYRLTKSLQDQEQNHVDSPKIPTTVMPKTTSIASTTSRRYDNYKLFI